MKSIEHWIFGLYLISFILLVDIRTRVQEVHKRRAVHTVMLTLETRERSHRWDQTADIASYLARGVHLQLSIGALDELTILN
jgi:hypothetical protein